MMVITYYPETKQHNEILITFNLYIQGFRKGRRRGTLHSQLACSLWENSNDSHWPSRPNMNPFSEVTRNDDALKKNNSQSIFSITFICYTYIVDGLRCAVNPFKSGSRKHLYCREIFKWLIKVCDFL